MKEIKKIAVLTSGGDVPGLNACIRAIVKACSYHSILCYGVEQGYEGLISNSFCLLKPSDVTNIIHSGGTMLRSSRSEKFRTEEGRKKAFENLHEHQIDLLIIIGGDGTLSGAGMLAKEFNFPIIGIPKTIDNDISHTDFAIGFDTAVNFAMSAIDRIKDTANSHNRLFLVEVMGRNAGHIAWEAGLATGAEGIIIPETENDLNLLFKSLENKKNWKKRSYIVVVAEGDETGGAIELQRLIEKKFPELNTGVTILGHTQRGGSPSFFDRNLATRFGIEAVKFAIAGKSNIMVGIQNNQIISAPLQEIKNRPLNYDDTKEEYLKMLIL
jgi:6-phosphofructokinase 1